MGIYDRNYFQGSTGGWGSGPGSWPPVIKFIVLMNIGVFIAQIIYTRVPTIEEVRENSYGIETEYDFVEAYIEDRQNGNEVNEDFVGNVDQRRLIQLLLRNNGKLPRKKSKVSENAAPESETSQPAIEDAATGDSKIATPESAELETPASETPAAAPTDTAVAESKPDKSDDAELRREAALAYHEYLADMAVGSPRVSVVQSWLQLDTKKIMKGQIWRILTSAFCHDRHGLWHILFNMLGLIWFGIALEYMYGQREFLLFYLAAAILSGVAYVGLDLWTNESVPAIGASGAVMGVLMLYACHYPHHQIRIWFFFPIEMRWLVLLYVAFDLHPLLLRLAGDQIYTSVAHAAHLGGLAFGFLYWNQRLRLAPMVDSLRNFELRKWFPRKSNPNVKLHSPEEHSGQVHAANTQQSGASGQSRVDELLIKISREGRDNLTEEEIDILNQASERLRQKKK